MGAIKKPRRTAKKKILTIEDNPTDRKFIQRILEKKGYRVYAAETAAKGLGMAASKNPDLILMDELLPDMSGSDACRQLKASKETRQIPVIFLTVVDSPSSIIEHFELDAVTHLTKPINAKMLIDQIEMVFVAGG